NAAAKAAAVGRAKARLAVARGELTRLSAASQAAYTAYVAAQNRLKVAQGAAARATLALQTAGEDVAAGRQALGQAAAASYRSGGDFGMWATLLSASGPQAFLDRASALQTVAARQQDALGRLQSAQVVQHLAQEKAQQALADVSAA